MTALAGILTLVFVVVLGLLLYGPIYRERFDRYGMRIRPRKKIAPTTALPPRASALLAMCRALGTMVLSVGPGLADRRSKQLLLHANYRTAQHLATFMGIKALVTSLTACCVLISAPGNPMLLLLVVPALLVSWLAPNFWLARRVASRQEDSLRELPIVIDLLIVCAQAGLGLLNCLDKVNREVKQSCPNLSVEFEQLLQDVRVFAKPVGAALADMGERCGVQELNALAASLIAAEAKGSDISYPLKMQSEATRERLKRKQEEAASKVPVKMVPVIMVFIMPLILCPLLGPAIDIIIKCLGSLNGST